MKPDIRTVIREQRLYFDGGTGTVLQSLGLPAGEAPEVWDLLHPELVTGLHRAYLNAGCRILKTNTFGVNRGKYLGYREMIAAAVACAKRAAAGREDVYIAFDMGPTGRLIEPLGDLPFEEAVSLFADNVKAAVEAGVDLILIETMNDSYETKAAVLAAKDHSDLPIFVTNVYDERGRLMTGASPAAMVALLEGLGVDALGVNCGFGPDKMEKTVRELLDFAEVPVIVSPNAGMPTVVGGVTGHRAIRPEDAAAIRAAVRAELRKLKEAVPHSPLVLLCSLAEGGDLLCADTAEDLGIPLLAVLPRPREDYETDFSPAARERFAHHCARAERGFAVPAAEDLPGAGP